MPLSSTARHYSFKNLQYTFVKQLHSQAFQYNGVLSHVYILIFMSPGRKVSSLKVFDGVRSLIVSLFPEFLLQSTGFHLWVAVAQALCLLALLSLFLFPSLLEHTQVRRLACPFSPQAIISSLPFLAVSAHEVHQLRFSILLRSLLLLLPTPTSNNERTRLRNCYSNSATVSAFILVSL